MLNVATKFSAGTATEWLSSATGASGITGAITSALGGGSINAGSVASLAANYFAPGAGAVVGALATSPGLSSVIDGFAQSAQFAQVFSFASSFLGGGGNPLEAGTVTPPAATNTVNRQTVNQAVLAIIGNNKIPVPDFVPTA